MTSATLRPPGQPLAMLREQVTILNVDDNDAGRYLKSRHLAAAGFRVIEAVNGTEALKLVESEGPDLVLLDVKLPDISGIEVCRQLKTDARTRFIPIVHLSATHIDVDMQVLGLETGADGYLTAPVEPAVLIATIKALLRARRAEENLGRSERALDDLFENAPIGLRLVSPEGILLRINRAELAMLGLTADDCLGEHVSMLHASSEDAQWIVDRLANGHTVDDLETQVRTAEGKCFHVLISANAMQEGGQFVHTRWFVRDVTERRNAEDRLKAQAQELIRSNQDLEDFAYIASHDLKEPLRGITNYSKFLLDDYGPQLDDEARRMLETLKRLSKRMDGLIGSLMEYSRVGRSDLAVGDTDLNEVLAVAVDALGGLLEEERGEVRIVQPLPVIRCDAVRIGEVFRNLIVNAIKYNQSERKVVEVGIAGPAEVPAELRAEGGPSQVVLYFRDNGIGIERRHHSAIFRMFKRLHGRDEYGGGTGSGLAIVERVMERHGGRVSVDSEPGKGATFYLRL
jgi:PAS domain S-box-containing protein